MKKLTKKLKTLVIAALALMVAGIAIASMHLGKHGIQTSDRFHIGSPGINTPSEGGSIEGTYWAEARTGYWSTARTDLWDTARNAEVP